MRWTRKKVMVNNKMQMNSRYVKTVPADKMVILFYMVFGVGVIGIAARATRAAMLVMVPYVLLACSLG